MAAEEINEADKKEFYADNKDTKEEQNELKKIVMPFLERSTLPAVGVLQQKKISMWRRVVWMVIVICGISISIYQSIQVVDSYLKYPVFIMETEKVNTTVLFPSITLCPQNIVDWEKIMERNHSIGSRISNLSMYEYNFTTPIHKRVMLEGFLMKELYLLKKNERDELLYSQKDWLTYCFVSSMISGIHSCYNYVVTPSMYSPYYGKCITINPGTDPKTMLSEDNKSEMLIMIELSKKKEFPFMARSSGILVSIHPPGSAPTVHWNKYIIVPSGKMLHAAMTVYDMRRLPHPYASNCTTEESELAQEVFEYSPYGSYDLVYSYSREECMATCFFLRIFKIKNCINAFMAVNEITEYMDADLCSSDLIDEELLSQVENDCSAICKIRCNELEYDWTPSIVSITEGDGYINDLFQAWHSKETRNTAEMVLLTLKMDSTIYVIGEETPKYMMGDVLGAIGGNLGLWIGVSLLTIFEVLELIASVIVYFVLKIFFCCFKKKN